MDISDDNVQAGDAAIPLAVGSLVFDAVTALDSWRPMPSALKEWLTAALSALGTMLVYALSAWGSGKPVPVAKAAIIAFGTYGKSKQSYATSKRKLQKPAPRVAKPKVEPTK